MFGSVHLCEDAEEHKKRLMDIHQTLCNQKTVNAQGNN